jgi:hypothetical protein
MTNAPIQDTYAGEFIQEGQGKEDGKRIHSPGRIGDPASEETKIGLPFSSVFSFSCSSSRGCSQLCRSQAKNSRKTQRKQTQTLKSKTLKQSTDFFVHKNSPVFGQNPREPKDRRRNVNIRLKKSVNIRLH